MIKLCDKCEGLAEKMQRILNDSNKQMAFEKTLLLTDLKRIINAILDAGIDQYKEQAEE